MSTQELNERDIESLIGAVETKVEVPKTLGEEFYYASLPLCVIDSIFSMGANYTSVKNVVARWCAAHNWTQIRSDTAEEHSIGDMLALLQGYTPLELAEGVFNNRKPTSSKSGILRPDAVIRFSKILQSHGVERFADLQTADFDALWEEIRHIPGQASGKCFDYFRMLAGDDERVKADRMLCRFVGHAIGLGREASPDLTSRLMIEAAHRMAVAPRTLDYAVWTYQRALVPA